MLRELAVWLVGRLLAAVVVFQMLSIVPWGPNLGPVARLIAVAAIPGSIELVVGGWILLNDN